MASIPTPGSSDGSAPAHGEIVSEASGGRPRTPRRGDQTAGIATDGTRSPEMAMVNDAARAAQRLVNWGAADSDGAASPRGLDGLSDGGGSKGNTWADPSSLAGR